MKKILGKDMDQPIANHDWVELFCVQRGGSVQEVSVRYPPVPEAVAFLDWFDFLNTGVELKVDNIHFNLKSKQSLCMFQ